MRVGNPQSRNPEVHFLLLGLNVYPEFTLLEKAGTLTHCVV